MLQIVRVHGARGGAQRDVPDPVGAARARTCLLVVVPAAGPSVVNFVVSTTKVLAPRLRLPLHRWFPLRSLRGSMLKHGCCLLKQWSSEGRQGRRLPALWVGLHVLLQWPCVPVLQ